MIYRARKLKRRRDGRWWSFQYPRMDYCCGRMKEAIENGWVAPASKTDELCVWFSEGYDDAIEVIGIYFCPWCGQGISIDLQTPSSPP